MYFPTLVVMLLSCLFYWLVSWYMEKVFPGKQRGAIVLPTLDQELTVGKQTVKLNRH